MLRLALRAVAPPATAGKPRRGPAIGAKAVARMPMKDGLRFGDRRQVIGGNEPLHGDRPQVRYQQIAAAFQRLGQLR